MVLHVRNSSHRRHTRAHFAHFQGGEIKFRGGTPYGDIDMNGRTDRQTKLGGGDTGQ